MKTNENILARVAAGVGLALLKTPQARQAIGQIYRNTRNFLSGSNSSNNDTQSSSNTQSSNTSGTAGKMGTNSTTPPNGDYGGSFGGQEALEEYKPKSLRDILVLKSD
jgi:hypothetical protein